MPRSSSFSEALLRAPAVCREQSLAQAAPDAFRRGSLDGNGLDDRETARLCRRIAQGGEQALAAPKGRVTLGATIGTGRRPGGACLGCRVQFANGHIAERVTFPSRVCSTQLGRIRPARRPRGGYPLFQ
jgi:hypothetical protein